MQNVFFNKDLSLFSKILLGIILVLLSSPNNLFSETSLHHFQTPLQIHYLFIDDHVSYLFIPIIILSFFYGNTGFIIRVYGFLAMVFAVSFFHDLNEKTYLFSEGSGALFYHVMVGASLAALVAKSCRHVKDLESFFITFMYLQILGMIAGILLNLNNNGGRYYAPNLDVGTTGTFFGIFFTFLLFCYRTPRFYQAGFVFFLILLTGSRTNLILPGLVLLYFGFIYILKSKQKKRFAFTLSLLIFLIFLVLKETDGASRELFDLGRLETLTIGVETGDVWSDSSLVGRLDSLRVGVAVLLENPAGIAFSFTDLQSHMQERGYPTFPHSALLSYLILLGPLTVFVLFTLYKKFRPLYRIRHNFRFPLTYLLVYLVIAGGPFVNFKIYFFIIIIFWMAIRYYNEVPRIKKI